jgi:hypothetical protein
MDGPLTSEDHPKCVHLSEAWAQEVAQIEMMARPPNRILEQD